MSKDAVAQAMENVKPFIRHDSVQRFADYLRARREMLRDRLESEENDQVRGRLQELKELLRLLSE